MALDIYVGPLTLYYAGQWENLAQKAARQNGYIYNKILLRDDKDAVTDPEVIRPAIVAWRDQLSEALGGHLPERLDWDETTSGYSTARPNYEGLGALVLWAVYADHPDLTRPARYSDFFEDAAYKRSAAKDSETRFPLVIRDIEFWLPSDFHFLFKADGPNGDAVMFGSTFGLLKQLQALNDATWQAERSAIEDWGKREPFKDAPLEDLAKFGFSEMFFSAVYACEKRLPMKLDY